MVLCVFDIKLYADKETYILTDHMTLLASQLALASVWICYFTQDVIRWYVGLTYNLAPINMYEVGYS